MVNEEGLIKDEKWIKFYSLNFWRMFVSKITMPSHILKKRIDSIMIEPFCLKNY